MGYHLCNWRPQNKKKEQNRRNIGKDNDQQFSKTEKRHQPTDLRSSVKSKNSKLKKKIQFSHSVTSNSWWPHECSTPGLPVHHQSLEFTQTHVHWVSDAIQPSHPLSSPSPPALNLSQHQSLFQWVTSSHEVAKALEFQLQHQSFQWTHRTHLL